MTGPTAGPTAGTETAAGAETAGADAATAADATAALDRPSDLVAAARRVLDHPEALSGSAWARSTALLARQALEAAIADFWLRVEPEEMTGSFTTQLLCLRSYVPAEVATGAFEAWAGLSTACHHHAYDLAPTAAELHRWVETVTDLVTALRRATA